MRLVNIAISRAESQLIVLMQDDSRKSNSAHSVASVRFGRIRFKATPLGSRFNKKSPKQAKPAPEAKVNLNPVAEAYTLAENFQEELLEGSPHQKTREAAQKRDHVFKLVKRFAIVSRFSGTSKNCASAW